MEKMQYEVPSLKELEKDFELVYGGQEPVIDSPEPDPADSGLESIY